MEKRNPIIIHPMYFDPGKKPEFKNIEIYKNQTSVLKGWHNMGFWKYDKPRDVSQNNHYWGFVVGDPMKDGTPCNYFGCWQKQLHEAYKKDFNNGRSSTILTYKEFENYTFKIKIYMAENHGVVIPDRNQVDFI